MCGLLSTILAIWISSHWGKHVFFRGLFIHADWIPHFWSSLNQMSLSVYWITILSIQHNLVPAKIKFHICFLSSQKEFWIPPSKNNVRDDLYLLKILSNCQVTNCLLNTFIFLDSMKKLRWIYFCWYVAFSWVCKFFLKSNWIILEIQEEQ